MVGPFDPEIDKLLDEIKGHMNSLGSVLGSSFNDLDVHVEEIHGGPQVTAVVVSVHHQHRYEYGAWLALDKVKRLPASVVAAYFFGVGAGRYEEERVPHIVATDGAAVARNGKAYDVLRGDTRIGHIKPVDNDRFAAYAGGDHGVFVGEAGDVFEAIRHITGHSGAK